MLSGKIKWPKVKRKEWLLKTVQWKLDGLTRYKNKISSKPELLSSMGLKAAFLAIFKLKSERNQIDFLEQLNFAHQCLTWHYHGLFNEGPHHVSIPGIPAFTFEGRFRPNIDVAHRKWMKAMDIAYCLRDTKALEVYSKVPIEPFMERGGLSLFPLEVPMTKLVQTFWLNPANAMELIDETIALAQPSNLDDLTEEDILSTQSLLLPWLEMYRMILRNDEDGFNSKLKQAVKAYKKNHLKSPNGPNRMELFLPFHLIAPVCIAHDRGMKITVRSDYLPEFLVRGEFEPVEWKK